MNPQGQFLPPQNEKEFKERAEKINLSAAISILDSLKQRRKALVVTIDAEIDFYEAVVNLKKSEASL